MAKKFLTGLTLVNLDSDPLSGSEGELYFNTSASVAKIYKSGQWSELGAGGGSNISVGSTEPVNPEIGDGWYDNTDGSFYIYDGTYWVEVNGTVSLSQEQVQDYVAPLFTNATNTNVIATYDDENNVINLNTSGSLVSVDSIVYPDYITFDTTPETSASVAGTMFWDNGEGTPAVVLNSDVTLQIGQENVALCYNGTGSTISNGAVVYISGAQGQRPSISLASASSEAGSSKTFGIVTQDIANGAEGFVATFGIVNGLNTAGLTEGSAVWLSTTPGQFTQTRPTQPNHLVFVGYVLKANELSGRVFVNPQNGYEIEELHNVLITSASAQQAILLDTDGLWKNERIVNSVNGTNNQISIDTDGYGDVTFSLPNDLITPGNLTVSGDLTVSGSTTFINTEQLNIEDNIITLNSGVTGAPTLDAGIEVERGTEENSSILWDETNQVWKFSNDVKTAAVRNDESLQISVDSASVSSNLLLNTLNSSINIENSGNIDISLSSGSTSSIFSLNADGTLKFSDNSFQNTAFLGMTSYSTTNLSEGTNLYFTNERAVSALSSTLSDYLTKSNASIIYQPLDSDLTAISSLSGSEGNLTTDGAGNWSIDTTQYLTESSASSTYLTQANAALEYADINHNHTLDSLSNVSINAISDGQAIVWSSASSSWVNKLIEGGASIDVSNTAPLSPEVGSAWYNNETGSFYIYDGTYWVEVNTIVSLPDEDIQDVASQLFTHSNHTNIVANYDDANNEIELSLSDDVVISNNLSILGNLTVSGSTSTIVSQNLSVTDNMIYLNAASDTIITGASGDGTYVTYLAENNYQPGMDIRIAGINPSSLNISSAEFKTIYSANASSFVVESSVVDAYVSGGTAHAKQETNPDLGFAGGYYSSGYSHSGLFRDASDGVWKFFDGYDPEPDEAVFIDTSASTGFTLAPISAGNANLSSLALSGSVTSGSWSANPIGYQYGGTGLTTLGTAGQVIKVNATEDGLEWGTGGGGGLSTIYTTLTSASPTDISNGRSSTVPGEAIVSIIQEGTFGMRKYASKVFLSDNLITEYAILESNPGQLPVNLTNNGSGGLLLAVSNALDASVYFTDVRVVFIEVTY